MDNRTRPEHDVTTPNPAVDESHNWFTPKGMAIQRCRECGAYSNLGSGFCPCPKDDEEEPEQEEDDKPGSQPMFCTPNTDPVTLERIRKAHEEITKTYNKAVEQYQREQLSNQFDLWNIDLTHEPPTIDNRDFERLRYLFDINTIPGPIQPMGFVWTLPARS